MNLILWRHGAAFEGPDDMDRRLTARGQRQVAQVAQWLQGRLPSEYTVFASPAMRAQQTARALTGEFRVLEALAPGHPAVNVPAAIGWPSSRGTVVIVGHQPMLGHLASLLLDGVEGEWSIKKAGVWWLANRDRDEGARTLLRAVITPDFA